MPTLSKKKYWDDWWSKNKDEMNRRRRERWASDPALRKIHTARVSAHQSMLSAMRTFQRMHTNHAGQEEKLYYLNQMESVVQRDVGTLRRWREQGTRIFPKALYYDRRSRSLYAESQVKYIAALLAMVDADEVFLTFRFMGQTLAEVWSKRYSLASLRAALATVPRKYKHENDKEDRANGSYVKRRETRRGKYRDIFTGKRPLRTPRSRRGQAQKNDLDR